MIITRKIQVFIPEDDKDLRKSYYEKLYNMRNAARSAANLTASHLFMLNMATPYLSDKDRETLTWLGAKGDPASKGNAPYVAVSDKFKGLVDMGMLSNVIQNVQKSYTAEIKDLYAGRRSLRSYRSNIPIPFQAKKFELREADYVGSDGVERNGVFFTLSKIPFQMKFGRDRSGNRCIVDRILSGEYKMATSSIQIDDKKRKIFLLLCVDIPKKEVKQKKGKTMYAFLGVMNPIICTTETYNPYTDDKRGLKVWEIGTKEEFNYRRRQIQDAVKRCKSENKYTKGGKGRKRKLQSLDRFEDKESNYVDTKLHTYSRHLVDLAVKHECDTIYLMKQPEREKKAKDDRDKGDDFVIRQWSYFSLKTKIKYKANMVGIKLKQDKEKEDETECEIEE